MTLLAKARNGGAGRSPTRYHQHIAPVALIAVTPNQ